MPTGEKLRLERLLSRQETLVKEAFVAFLAGARSDRTMAEVSTFLERRDVENALRIVDTYVVRLGTVVPALFQGAAAAEVLELGRKIGERIGGVAIAFDPTNPRAAALMRDNQLQFVREFDQEQRQATRFAISNALQEGWGVADTSRAFRDSIGLTTRQEQAVTNYRDLLRRGSAAALDRALRDRHFDPSVERAAAGEPLKAAQIDTMTVRYRQRYLAYRAETIARTEGVGVTSLARQEAFNQTVSDLNINPNLVVRIWNATNDRRTRDSHLAMDGQEVGQDEPFISGNGVELMYPGDPSAPADEVINCRCTVTMDVRQAA